MTLESRMQACKRETHNRNMTRMDGGPATTHRTKSVEECIISSFIAMQMLYRQQSDDLGPVDVYAFLKHKYTS